MDLPLNRGKLPWRGSYKFAVLQLGEGRGEAGARQGVDVEVSMDV